MNLEHESTIIVTAQAEFLEAALDELRRLDQRLFGSEILAPEIALCHLPADMPLRQLLREQQLIFVRHLAPVQIEVPLTNTEQDVGKLAIAIADLPTFAQLERGQPFSVQTRFVHTDGEVPKRSYSSGQLNAQLAEAIAEETGAVESIRRPRIVVSLLCATRKAYVGISLVEENLSDWPGGMRHFAQTAEQISRSEFKLLEALEVFGLTLPEHGQGLDLGAAPGGWTRLLLGAGMHVVAVDPAELDARLEGHPALEHYHGYAEVYLEEAVKEHRRFDVVVNDMRIDAREAARGLAWAASCLHADGFAISTLKLPHATSNVDPLKNLREALSILSRYYGIVRARQLFHNRQEVTVVAAKSYR